ncbi:MAG: hypothetical protein BroJett011_24480 [Chloroflexota bacterium]|nr:MAG: hypothetical protein BroJett011_24480 [Chloroflexota bacterium]
MVENLEQKLKQGQIGDVWQSLTKTDQVNVGEAERLVSLFGGVLVALFGLRRLSLPAVSLVLGGGYLLYRGLSGHCPAYNLLNISTVKSKLRFDEEYHEQPESTIDPDDLHDEAVWESFPASDPATSW